MRNSFQLQSTDFQFCQTDEFTEGTVQQIPFACSCTRTAGQSDARQAHAIRAEAADGMRQGSTVLLSKFGSQTQFRIILFKTFSEINSADLQDHHARGISSFLKVSFFFYFANHQNNSNLTQTHDLSLLVRDHIYTSNQRCSYFRQSTVKPLSLNQLHGALGCILGSPILFFK